MPDRTLLKGRTEAADPPDRSTRADRPESRIAAQDCNQPEVGAGSLQAVRIARLAAPDPAMTTTIRRTPRTTDCQ